MRVFLLILIFVATIVVGVAQFVPNIIPLPLVIGSVVVGATAAVIGIAPNILQRIEDRRAVAASTIEPNWTANLIGKLNAFELELREYVTLAGEVEIKPRIDLLLADEKAIPTQSYNDILEAIREHIQVVIIGAPGAGKSTAMKRLFVAVAKARLYKEYDPLLVELYRPRTKFESGESIEYPLWIDLGYSENEPDALALLNQHWHSQNLPGNVEQALRDNKIWLFLDGLNEMPEQNASRLKRAESLKAIISKFPTVRVIVSCREADYQQSFARQIEAEGGRIKALNGDKLLLGELPVLRIAPLDRDRIVEFCNSRLKEKAPDLIRILDSYQALHELAANPYTLVLFAATYQQYPEFLLQLAIKEDADRLSLLFEQFFRVTYEDLNQKRNEKKYTTLIKLPENSLRTRMRKLAFEMIAWGKGTVAERQWAEKRIGKAAIRDGINMNILRVDIQSSKQSVRFVHQTLHTFFASPLIMDVLETRSSDLVKWHRLVDAIRNLAEAALPAMPPLIAALKVGNEDIRTSVIVTLSSMGSSAIPSLITAFQSGDDKVRSGVAIVLSRIGIPAIPALIDMLKVEDAQIRTNTIWALSSIGTPAVPLLVIALDSDVSNIQSAVGEILYKIGIPAVTALTTFLDENILNDEKHSVTLEVKEILHKIGLPAVSGLIRMIDSEKLESRIAAVDLLGNIGALATEAIPRLVSLLNHENEELYRSAIGSLVGIGIPAIPSLIAALDNNNWRVRRAAVGALTAIGAPAVSPLLKLLNSGNYDKRNIAEWAISSMTDEAIAEAIRDQPQNTRKDVEGTLSTIQKSSRGQGRSSVLDLDRYDW